MAGRDRWDDRPLWERIKAEAQFKQIDLSKFITIQEAARIMHCSEHAVRRRYCWLEGIELCGRKLVKRKRVEWLRRFRDHQLSPDDLMGESLAPFDVAAARMENERKKAEEEERRRQQAEARRPKGFHIDGKIWWDYDNNDTWIPVKMAVINLGIAIQNVHDLANRGVIRRRYANRATWKPVEAPFENRKSKIENSMRGFSAMFSLRDIEAYLERRDNRGRRRSFSFDDPDRPFTPTRVYEMESSAHENCIIPLWRAAQILGVQQPRVSNLVTKGKLKAYQRIPNRRGVEVWFSLKQVLEYANNPDRLKARRAYDEYIDAKKKDPDYVRKSPEPYQPEFGGPEIGNGIRNLKKDHGEYYTVRQAALILGCSPSAVKEKIKNKRIPACRANRKEDTPDKWNTQRWWFIKKEDLHNYKASREYRKNQKRFIEARHRKLFGENIDGTPIQRRPLEWPATPGEDHYIPHDPRNITFLRGEQGRARLDEYQRWWESEKKRAPKEPAVTPGEDGYIPHDPRNVVFLKTKQQRWREEAYAHIKEIDDLESDPRINGYYPGHFFNEGHKRKGPT